MARDLELRLIGAPVPDGEIAAKDLAALAGALQELMTRVSRDVVGSVGPGRTKRFIEEFAQLRLRYVGDGSTTLTFTRGSVDKLDIDLPEYETADRRFWETVNAIGQDMRPDWVSEPVAESAGRFVTAMRDAAPRSTLRDSDHAPVEIESSRIRPETWTAKRVATTTRMEARGRLEMVNLRSHEFRVRDDVGQAVDLLHVRDDTHAAQHVGQWVIAEGDGVFLADGLVALDNAGITLVDDPAKGLEHDDLVTLEDLLAGAPGPDPSGGIDLSDDEFAAFLEAARQRFVQTTQSLTLMRPCTRSADEWDTPCTRRTTQVTGGSPRAR